MGSGSPMHLEEHHNTLEELGNLGTDRVGDIEQPGSLSKWVVIAPSSQRLLAWDALVFLLLAWDLLTLPLLAFGFDKLPFVNLADLITNIVWTIDLPVSALRGYVERGKLVMDLRSIAKRRLVTVVPDVLILTTDWCRYWLDISSIASVVRAGKALRICRVVRFLRFARVVKALSLLEHATGLVLSQTLYACLSILRLLFCVMIFCHLGACFWFALGTPQGWVDTWLEAQPDQELDLVHAYLVSFHWAFAQFTPAPPPDNTSPQSIAEEAGVIVVLLAGWVLFMFLLGSVNYFLQIAKQDTSRRMKEQLLFQQYAAEHKLPLSLYNQILSFFRSRGAAPRSTVAEGDLQSLGELPESVLRKLHLAVFMGAFKSHPLFQRLADLHPSFVMDTCHLATTMRPLGKGSELFASRTPATRMFFVRRCSEEPGRGALRFQGQTCHEALDDQRPAAGKRQFRSALIQEGSWFCELTLWLEPGAAHEGGLPLLHTGRAQAEHRCDVAELEAPKFRDIAKRHPRVLKDLAKYAGLFAAGFEDHGGILELWGTDGVCPALVHQVYPVSQPSPPTSNASLGSIARILALTPPREHAEVEG